MTGDVLLTELIRTMLESRRFFVVLNGKKSRWRRQRNGLPKEIVLAPMLFNIYTNDQSIGLHADTRSFIYTDDLCIASQGNDFVSLLIWTNRSRMERTILDWIPLNVFIGRMSMLSLFLRQVLFEPLTCMHHINNYDYYTHAFEMRLLNHSIQIMVLIFFISIMRHRRQRFIWRMP